MSLLAEMAKKSTMFVQTTKSARWHDPCGCCLLSCTPSLFQNESFDNENNLLLQKANYSNIPPLRKHAYSNILKIILQPKKENFQIKHSDIFHILAQNIDCGIK